MGLYRATKSGPRRGKMFFRCCSFSIFGECHPVTLTWQLKNLNAWMWNLNIQINGKHCALKLNVIFFSLFGICCILVQKYFGHFLRILFMFLAENLGFALELSGMHCMQKHDRSPMCLSQYRALSPQINLPAAHTLNPCFSKKKYFFIKYYLKTTLNQIDSIFPETFH